MTEPDVCALARSLAARPRPWTGAEQDGARLLLVRLADDLDAARRLCADMAQWAAAQIELLTRAAERAAAPAPPAPEDA